MKNLENLKLGDQLTNQELYEVFGCGNSGGMRRAKKTNNLVIISSHVKSIYEDRWDGDILLYTGMGQKGDQNLSFQQNKTLAESHSNGVNIHLFESFKVNEYIYLGQVELIASPFEEQQPDDDGKLRKVFIFPLRLKAGIRYIDKESIEIWNNNKERKVAKLSNEELKKRASKRSAQVSHYKTTINQYVRNEYVMEYAKRLANGKCQLCDEHAPFNDKKGQPYLETHHIEWLAKGGDDTINNTVALCPNCHKRMHILDLAEDKLKLFEKVKLMIDVDVLPV